MSVDSYWRGMGPNMFAGLQNLQIIVHRSRRISTNRSQYCCSYISPSTQFAARINSESGTSLLFTIPCGCKVEQQGTLWTALGHWQFGSRTWHFWRRHGWARWNRVKLAAAPHEAYASESPDRGFSSSARAIPEVDPRDPCMPGDFVNSISKQPVTSKTRIRTPHVASTSWLYIAGFSWLWREQSP